VIGCNLILRRRFARTINTRDKFNPGAGIISVAPLRDSYMKRTTKHAKGAKKIDGHSLCPPEPASNA